MNKNIAIAVIINIFITGMGILTYDFYRSQNVIYTVDINKLYTAKKKRVDALIEERAGLAAIEEAKEEYVKYIKKIETYLAKLSKVNKITIFNSRAVFSKHNTLDITQEIDDATK